MNTFLWLYLYALIFIAGLCFGSFMNVLIYRIPRGISTVKGRSFCPDCGHTLHWYDLFPVFSYVFLGGRCRYCKKPISPRYAVIELLNALLWLAYAAKYIYTPITMLAYFLFGSALLCIIYVDAQHMLIFDRFNIAIAIAGLVIAAEPLYIADPCLYTSALTIWDRLIGAVCISGLFYLIALISRGRAMGGGDIKLTAAAGFVLGWQNMLAMLVIASVAGTIGSLIQLAVKNHKSKKAVGSDTAAEKTESMPDTGKDKDKALAENDENEDDAEPIGHAVPFGPYLAGAMIIMSFVGTELINIYLKLCGY